MKPELEEILLKKYPKLFRQRYLPMTQTCMCWGIECGSGWFDVLDKMCELVQNHIDNTRKNIYRTKQFNRVLNQAIAGNDRNLRYYYFKLYKNEEEVEKRVKFDVENKPKRVQFYEQPCPQLEFTQIKEKFGTLRVYTSGGDEYCQGAIDFACSMSSRICENCGKPAKSSRPGGWIRTVCKSCDRKRGPKK